MKDVLQGIADRISGPLYGYVSVSLVLFNWKWLALLFMSKYSVEVRITVIEQYFNWWVGLAAPLASGVAAALLTPFFHVVLASVHRKATKLGLSVKTKMAKDKAKADQEIARENAKSTYAQNIANEIEILRQKRVQSFAVRVETNIKNMRKDAHMLRVHHHDNVNKFKSLNGEVSTAIYMLETIHKAAESYQTSLPKDEHIEELIAGRGDFIKLWHMNYGSGTQLPPFLQLNTEGFEPNTTIPPE